MVESLVPCTPGYVKKYNCYGGINYTHKWPLASGQTETEPEPGTKPGQAPSCDDLSANGAQWLDAYQSRQREQWKPTRTLYIYLYIYLTVLCLLGNAFEPYAKAEDALGGAFTSAVTNQHAAQAQS